MSPVSLEKAKANTGCPDTCHFTTGWRSFPNCLNCGATPGFHGTGHPHQCLISGAPDGNHYHNPAAALVEGKRPHREGPRVLKQAPPFLRTP